MGKVCLLRTPHLGSILAARRSSLVGILSESWPPHTIRTRPHQVDPGIGSLLEGYNHKCPFFLFLKKKKIYIYIYIYLNKEREREWNTIAQRKDTENT